jgi:uncharacterized integral membrane protein
VIVGHSNTDVDTKSARRAGRRDVLHLAVVLILVAAIAGLALDNRQEVSVGWIVGDATMPLYQLFVATFVVGILAGWVLRFRHHHHSSH